MILTSHIYNARHAHQTTRLAVKTSRPQRTIAKLRYSFGNTLKGGCKNIFDVIPSQNSYCTMGKLKLGIIREGKVPPDKRVPLSPAQCKEAISTFSNVDLVVQKSPIRKFDDSKYQDLGTKLQEDISDCDVIIGVKEVQIKDLIPNKKFFFFSHTIKQQPYNADLLRAVLDKNIELIDWETLTKPNGTRLIGFGRYAGIVGCYNGFLAWGKRFKSFDLKPAHQCEDRAEMEGEYVKIDLPSTTKIVITSNGRVARGAMEVLKGIGIKKVSPNEYLNQTFSEPVYTQLSVEHYSKMPDDSPFVKADFYKDGSKFVSDFKKWSAITDFFIPCHYYESGSPYLFTREEAKSSDFNIKVVADISCDIDGPVASTLRPSTVADPYYGYNPQTESECEFDADGAITVMAVDNLPCELPKDASEDFGKELLKNILPNLLIEDCDDVLERATITRNGKLTERYSYLQNYVDRK